MTEKRKGKRGRPALPARDVQASTISFRTTGIIKDSIKEQAKREGVTIGEIMRRLVIQGVRDVE